MWITSHTPKNVKRANTVARFGLALLCAFVLGTGFSAFADDFCNVPVLSTESAPFAPQLSDEQFGVQTAEFFSAISGNITVLRWWGLEVAVSFEGEGEPTLNLTECSRTSTDFDVTFFSDAAGTPDVPLGNVVLAASRVATGRLQSFRVQIGEELDPLGNMVPVYTGGDFTEYEYTVTLPFDVASVLPSGGWVSVVAINEVNGCGFVWVGSAVGTDTAVQRQYPSSDPFDQLSSNVAFCLLDAATLTPLAIGIHPVDLVVDTGDDASFSIGDVSGGRPPYEYEWFYVPSSKPSPTITNLTGVNDPTLFITGVNTGGNVNNGTYFCRVSDSTPVNTQSLDSNSAELTVIPGLPVGGLLGLNILAAALASVGAVAIRRRKK